VRVRRALEQEAETRAALLLLQRTVLRPLAGLVVVVAAGLWGASRTGIMLPSLPLGLSLPEVSLPDWGNLWTASEAVLLPLVALTVTNAALITAAIAAELYPEDRARITPDRLALTSGALNIVLAPIGAFPMCHGAGGLVVQHRFGARTGLAPTLFGVTCLLLGVLLGPDALGLLSLLPMAAVGALLVIAGTDVAHNKRLRRTRPDGLVVILLTGLTCVIVNVAAGLVVGIFLELARAFVMRRHPPLRGKCRADQSPLLPEGDRSALPKVRIS
jgi:MFS superfamily sulfate permease-like transporter